jgi:hypothetical protein
MVQQQVSPAQGTLSTQDDAVRICQQLAGYDFPWELTRSLELAVLKTFCVPRISGLLRKTGEFTRRPQKRYDDTTLILGNLLKWGYDSPQGRAAIARMNVIHNPFDILNEDFLYVLSTAIYEPIRWNQRFGWRPFTAAEKQALFEFWRVVGQRMGIAAIPATSEELERFNQAYEAEHFQYHRDNAVVGDAVIRLMQGWFPAIAAPLVPMVVRAIADDALCRALGWPKPHPSVTRGVVGGLQWSRKIAKAMPRRRRAGFVVDLPNKTYGKKYQIDTLGPDASPSEQSASRCPFLKMRSFLKADV